MTTLIAAGALPVDTQLYITSTGPHHIHYPRWDLASVEARYPVVFERPITWTGIAKVYPYAVEGKVAVLISEYFATLLKTTSRIVWVNEEAVNAQAITPSR